MKIVIHPSVFAVPFLKAGALLPVTLAALLLMSGSLLAAPKQDGAALTQALFTAPDAKLATPGLGQLRFATCGQASDFTRLIAARPHVADFGLRNSVF